jgi:menaquinone-dependent protoporphyrinogen IX oxidase
MKNKHNIKELENEQIGIYYDVTEKKLTDIKIEIMEDIMNVFGGHTGIDNNTFVNHKEFQEFIGHYQTAIQDEKKDILMILIEQEQDIQKEIRERQIKMLKEIDITIPSIRVHMIVDEMGGKNFQMFDMMIKYIKLAKKNKIETRPQNRRLYVPPKLVKIFGKI